MQLLKTAGHRFQTKQEFVYQTLRAAIMHGDFAPGERLRTEELAQRLGVSPSPVREALQLLQSERLVETIPHVGARVAPLSPDSIKEVFTVMEGLELVATRAAAARLTAADLRDLTALVAQMDSALDAGDHESWGDLNTRFHSTIAGLTGMPLLQEMTTRALDQWDRVRRYYLKGMLTQRLNHAQAEHHAIVQAMREQDYPLLERLVKEHNQGALAGYMAYVSDTATDAPLPTATQDGTLTQPSR